ncbi:MAG: hypothetical protein WDO56_15070 [Gammaproteobacteria bacterium]
MNEELHSNHAAVIEKLDAFGKNLGDKLDALGGKLDQLGAAFEDFRSFHITVVWVCGALITVVLSAILGYAVAGSKPLERRPRRLTAPATACIDHQPIEVDCPEYRQGGKEQ